MRDNHVVPMSVDYHSTGTYVPPPIEFNGMILDGLAVYAPLFAVEIAVVYICMRYSHVFVAAFSCLVNRIRF